MPEKDPANYSLITYAWMIGLAVWGGMVRYFQRINAGHDCFRWFAFGGEIIASGFFGIITFYLAKSADIDSLVTAAMVGVSGHMGVTINYYVRQFVQRRLGIKISITDETQR